MPPTNPAGARQQARQPNRLEPPNRHNQCAPSLRGDGPRHRLRSSNRTRKSAVAIRSVFPDQARASFQRERPRPRSGGHPSATAQGARTLRWRVPLIQQPCRAGEPNQASATPAAQAGLSRWQHRATAQDAQAPELEAGQVPFRPKRPELRRKPSGCPWQDKALPGRPHAAALRAWRPAWLLHQPIRQHESPQRYRDTYRGRADPVGRRNLSAPGQTRIRHRLPPAPAQLSPRPGLRKQRTRI